MRSTWEEVWFSPQYLYIVVKMAIRMAMAMVMVFMLIYSVIANGLLPIHKTVASLMKQNLPINHTMMFVKVRAMAIMIMW